MLFNDEKELSVMKTDLTYSFPSSRKVYVQGSQPDIAVPMREIHLSPTETNNGNGASEPNEPLLVYDTSGPFSDPSITVDIRRGLPPIRERWIHDREDVEELQYPTSQYGRARTTDPQLNDIRFPNIRKPLRARNAKNVSQMHYAKQGIVTPEMEFIALRENQKRSSHQAHSTTNNGNRNGQSAIAQQHPGNAWGANIPSEIAPEFVRDEVARGRAIIPSAEGNIPCGRGE